MRKHLIPAVTLAFALTLSSPLFAQVRDQDASSKNARGGRYDAEIQKKLQEKLEKDRFQNVRGSVEDGVVSLEGSVALLAHKQDAEERAKDIDHVSSVRNMIQVQTQDRISDAQLRETLAQKLRYDRIGYGIVYNALTLDIKDGIATVGGSVGDEADKASALAIVRNTPGVKGLRDQIDVQPVSIFDDELRIKLARNLYNDPVLSKYASDPQAPIRIIVKNGHVTLMGVVNSEMEKNVAGIRAREVSGVFSVDNKLMVAK
jgi:hyperosmotically inducible protein